LIQLLFNVQEQYVSYIQDRVYKTIKKRGRGGLSVTTFDWYWKSMESCI